MEKYLNQIELLLKCYNNRRCALFHHMNCDLNSLGLMKGRFESNSQTEADLKQLDIIADSMKCHCANCSYYQEVK